MTFIWPASSTKRTSTESAKSARDQSHGVPPSMVMAPFYKFYRASSFFPTVEQWFETLLFEFL